MKWGLVLSFGIIIGLAFSAGFLLVIAPPRGEPISLPSAPTSEVLFVSVIGAVNRPGVYKVSRDARIVDVIDQAGGFTPDAVPQSINMAAKIHDGDQIVVFSTTQQATQAAQMLANVNSDSRKPGPTVTPPPTFPININTATQLELENLPSIGAIKAAQIIAYRQEHGLFSKLEDLQNVVGIGSSTFDKIKDLITLGQ